MKHEILNSAIALRHELHAHPELPMQETWTKAHLMEFLKTHTKLEVVDRGRWFYAVFFAGDDKPNIAFRADFDALPIEESPDLVPYASENPGVSHKCGHDGHSAALAAFALDLDENGADKNVYLIFQHAEETGQGGRECAALLAEKNISEIYAVHNLPGLRFGAVAAPDGTAQFASTGMILTFEGKKSHACYPENGRNPAFAISELILALDSLAQNPKYRGMTLITVIAVRVGEHAFGTNAGHGELLLTVRGAFSEELDDLIRAIEGMAQERSAQYGLTCSVRYEDVFPDTFNHSACTEKVRRAARELGIPVEELAEPFRASEDFGWYTKEIPGAIFYIGGGDCPPIHTVTFDFPDALIEPIGDLYRKILAVCSF